MKKNITKKEKYRIIASRRKSDMQDNSGINFRQFNAQHDVVERKN